MQWRRVTRLTIIASVKVGTQGDDMKVGVPKEIAEGERRVALVPETVGRMVKDGYEVLVETGAGQDYNLDEDYEEVGAQIASDASEVYSEADIVVKIAAPTEDEVGYMHEGLVLVCLLDGTTYPELVKQLADVGVTVFSNELVPRTGAAQSMDVLSSMGSIAGYKCAIIAADAWVSTFPRFPPPPAPRRRRRSSSWA